MSKRNTKIDAKWLDTHQWCLRSHKADRTSYGGYKWKPIGEWNHCGNWTESQTCEGGGFFGLTPTHNAFGFSHAVLVLCEAKGRSKPVGNDKMSFESLRIVAEAEDIPDEAFSQCGMRVVRHDLAALDTSQCWLVIVFGRAVIGDITGSGQALFCDHSQCKDSHASGSTVFFDQSQCNDSHASGVTLFYGQSQCKDSHASGATVFYDQSQCNDSHASGLTQFLHQSQCNDSHASGLTQFLHQSQCNDSHASGETQFLHQSQCNDSHASGETWFCGESKDCRSKPSAKPTTKNNEPKQ